MSYVEHTFRDGSTVRGAPDNVALAVDIERKMIAQEGDWVARLRAAGVKAAHPDDGWVHRPPHRECVHLEYPQFNDGVEVGDLIALGWPWKDRLRIVRVTEVERAGFGLRYHYFEEVARYGDWSEPGARTSKKKRWWRRGR